MSVNHLEALKSALVGVLTVGSWGSIEVDHDKVQLAWHPELSPVGGRPSTSRPYCVAWQRLKS